MHVPTKARLAVAAVAASAVSMGVAAPSFAAATPARTAAPSAPTPVGGVISADLKIHPDVNAKDPLATYFVVHASDTVAGAKLTYTLDFGDGSTAVSGPVIGPDGTVVVHYTYKAAGAYLVKLSVTDGVTSVNEAAKYTTGTEFGPTALATVTTTPGSLAVSADLSKSAPGNGQTIALITLDWGDGSTTDLKSPTAKDLATPVAHTYKAAGSYTLKTTITDADGIAEAATTPVVVTSAAGGTAVSRIAGADRYQTAIAISSKLPAGSAPAVVLATGGTFPDALAGVPLAKKVGGPLLLTPGTGPNAAVTAEIKRVLKPGGTVYVLGGTNAVPQSVVQALGAVNVDRIGGGDRYETALKIADQLGDPSHVVLATGEDYADALAAGPYAADIFGADASHPAAILLTADKQLTPDVKAYLAKAGGTVAAVGGQAVAAAQSAHVALAPGASFRGYDRYFTAAMVAGAFKGETTAGVATGENFADALTGAASLARAGGPLVLTPTHLLAPATWAALQGIEAAVGASGTVEVFGGPAAVSGTTLQSVVTAVHGHLA
ncbi:cell wall-binding repeat-containing protein [Catenulispora pinisilvae]|uniref:cell wall-binding repeat-containing protein n=1 Tax=Catenulispora pinisilvae TaxID=2705253 RepID=UPI001890F0E9|nr:cell wall-binding repeat-containing protein [Catenulispora pinisilvae]